MVGSGCPPLTSLTGKQQSSDALTREWRLGRRKSFCRGTVDAVLFLGRTAFCAVRVASQSRSGECHRGVR